MASWKSFLLGTALILGPAVAHASVLFDFETAQNVGTGPLSSLTGTVGGLTAVWTRPGSDFEVANLSGNTNAPPGFGSLTLSPFTHSTSDTPFVLNFSKSLSGLSFQAGDFDGDSDIITFSIYAGANGTGAAVGTRTVNYGLGSFPTDISTLSLSSATPFRSAVFIGGSSDFPNSIYFDNFSATVSAVPLPAAAPLFGVALLAFGLLGSKRTRDTSNTRP